MRPALILLCGALLVGCEPAVEFDVDVDGEAVVQRGTALETLLGSFPVFDSFVAFDVSDTREFENHQTTKDHVREARITRITLSVVDPEDATFDFLDEITFFVESPQHPKEQVATKAVPSGARTVDLELRDIDVAPYVKDETFSVTTSASGRRPSQDVTVGAHMRLRIRAQP
jgi:hypothetical protein